MKITRRGLLGSLLAGPVVAKSEIPEIITIRPQILSNIEHSRDYRAEADLMAQQLQYGMVTINDARQRLELPRI